MALKAPSPKPDKACFKRAVDMSKVNGPVMRRWVLATLEKYLPEDDVACELVLALLFEAENDSPDIKGLRDVVKGFLGPADGLLYCLQLWTILLSAQDSPDGVPEQLVEERKRILAKQEAERARAQALQILAHGASARPSRGRGGRRTEERRLAPGHASRVPRSRPPPNAASAGQSAVRVTKPERKTNYYRS